MNRFTKFAAVALLAGAAVVVPAFAQAPQETSKIVMINFNALVLSTNEAKQELNTVQTKLTPRQTALKALNAEVETLGKELQAKPSTLSETERATRERTFAEKQRQLQRDAEELKSDLQSESQQVYAQVAQKLYAFLQSYGQQHGYTMIVERGSDAAPVVWYAAPQVDITADVVKAYNAAPPQAAPKPAATTPK
ncbi:MAG TPA: OmpH family outer membrane protein [Acidobacteriaceae bacterium]|nr:OmpH family outer membrane protein [Acidobacteriaceae bacterium]